MTTKEKEMLRRLASMLDDAAFTCGEIIGLDDSAPEPKRESSFRIVGTGGKPSPYPDVNFRLLSDIQAEEKMSVYLPFGAGSIRKRSRKNKNSRYTWWEGRFQRHTVTAKTQKEVIEKLKNIPLKEKEKTERVTKKGSSFIEWVNYWYETYKEPYLRSNSKRGYMDAFNKIKTY